MRITITDAMEAKRLMEHPHGPTKIVSLVGPDLKYELAKLGEHHCHHVFHDVESEMDTSELHGTEWEVEELIVPTREMCADVLEFGKTIDWNVDWVLVHCHAGRSRSAAALIALLVQEGWEPTEAVNYVGNMRYNMLPNRFMTQYFDELLEQNGKLNRAVRDWYDEYTGPGMLLRNKLGGWKEW